MFSSACRKLSFPMTLIKFLKPTNSTSSMFSVLYRLMRMLSSSGSQTKKVISRIPGSMMSQAFSASARFPRAERRSFCLFMKHTSQRIKNKPTHGSDAGL